MTSKISFFSLCIENLKRRIWLLVLSVLTFFISMPLTLMVVLQNETSYRSEIAEWRILEIFSNFFGIGFNSVLAPGFAIFKEKGGFIPFGSSKTGKIVCCLLCKWDFVIFCPLFGKLYCLSSNYKPLP